MYTEAHGPSLKKERERELEHLRIYAKPESDHEAPAWVVVHHFVSPTHEPVELEFSDGHEMLRHIANEAAVPEESHE